MNRSQSVALVILLAGMVFCKNIPETKEETQKELLLKDIQDDLKKLDNILNDAKKDKKQGKESTEINAFEEITKINNENHITNLNEGDIKIIPGDPRENRHLTANQKRNALRDVVYRWMTKIVPYVISSDLDYGTSVIKSALEEISANSCVRFKERTTQKNWIYFVEKKGCYSAVGRVFWTNEAQEISLGAGCMHKGIVMHEVMHSLGFYHEQSRYDRDNYIEVFWENIKPGEAHNFEKQNKIAIDHQEIAYDFDSIMHYGTDAFHKADGLKTIAVIGHPNQKMGQRTRLSPKDIIELNLLYDCKNINKDFFSSWSTYGPCSETSCTKTRQRFCSHTDINKCPGADYWGVEQKSIKCTQAECHPRIDGHWGRWSLWSSCNGICDSGTKTRNRSCDDPKPENSGSYCIGNFTSVVNCDIPSCSLGPFDCNFDFGMCHWKTISSDVLLWNRHRMATTTDLTGPSTDHTKGNVKGYYVYVEASSPAEEGNTATLLSRSFKPTTGRCMTFWYHMYGFNMGTLNVVLKQSGQTDKIIWTKSGDQGKLWKPAEITLKSNTKYKVAFKGIRGQSFFSDMALDDIFFKERDCALKRMNKLASVKQVGCYKHASTLFPTYKDMRPLINWYNITEVVHKCKEHVASLGYKYFGLVFYGECWYGPTDKVHFDKDGISTDCYSQAVGKEKTIMVYEMV